MVKAKPQKQPVRSRSNSPKPSAIKRQRADIEGKDVAANETPSKRLSKYKWEQRNDLEIQVVSDLKVNTNLLKGVP